MIILGTNSIKDTGYDVANSVRLDGDAYLHKTQSGGNRKTWTMSCWTKLTGAYGSNGGMLMAANGTSDATNFLFGIDNGGHSGSDTDTLSLHIYGADGFRTTPFLRDYSAWYHVVLAMDTTQATSTNRLKLYVNNVQQTLSEQSDYPSQNADMGVNNNGTVLGVGNHPGATSSYGLNSYMAEFVLIDGQQLAPTSFGEFDEDSNIWKPIDVSGLSFGTNGFYLDFEDSSNLGNDVNGGTDLTEVSLATTDQSTDTCTNNFATMNPLNVNPSSAGDAFTEGNLKLATSNNSNSAGSTATMAFTKGKWYAEVKYTSATAWNGVMPTDATINGDTGRINWYQGRTLYLSGSNTANWGSNVSAGDIVGIALDMDNSRVTISQSGQWWGGSSFNQAQPHTFQALISGYDTWTFLCASGSGTSTSEWNFGSPPFAISSGNQDANGYGNMEFPVPTDYFICNTKNLAEYG